MYRVASAKFGGKYKQAEELFWHTHKLRTEVLVAEHLQTLQTIDSLATALSLQGKHAEAEITYSKDAGGRYESARREISY